MKYISGACSLGVGVLFFIFFSISNISSKLAVPNAASTANSGWNILKVDSSNFGFILFKIFSIIAIIAVCLLIILGIILLLRDMEIVKLKDSIPLDKINTIILMILTGSILVSFIGAFIFAANLHQNNSAVDYIVSWGMWLNMICSLAACITVWITSRKQSK